MKYPELRGDSYRSIRQLGAAAIERNLALFGLGDLIDTRLPDPVTIGVLMSELDRLHDHKVSVLFLQGQHDLNRERPWLSCHRWPVHLGAPLIIHGVSFVGLDYQPPEILAAALKQLPQVDILFCHQVWKERMGGQIGRPADAAFADVPKVKMVVSGDFHAHKTTYHTGKDGQKLTAVSPGSTYLKTLDEDPAKYYYILYDDLSLESVPLQTRPVIRSRALTEVGLEEHLAYVRKLPKLDPLNPDKPIWHVEYSDGIPEIAARLEAAAQDRVHLFLRPMTVRDDESPDETTESNSSSGQGLVGFLDKCCSAESPVYNTTSRLLMANEPKAELERIVKETMAQPSISDGWN